MELGDKDGYHHGAEVWGKDEKRLILGGLVGADF